MLTTFDEDDPYLQRSALAPPATCSRTLSRTTCVTQSAVWRPETPLLSASVTRKQWRELSPGPPVSPTMPDRTS